MSVFYHTFLVIKRRALINYYIDYFKSNTDQAQLKKPAFVALKIALRTDK